MLNKRKKIRSVGGIKKKCIFAADFPSGSSSVGRAQPCQGWGREFESRFPLKCRDAMHCVSMCFKTKISCHLFHDDNHINIMGGSRTHCSISHCDFASRTSNDYIVV